MTEYLSRWIACSCGEKAEFTLYGKGHRVEMVLCEKCAEKYLETHPEVKTSIVSTD